MTDLRLIKAVEADIAKLERLVQLYLHDFSGYAAPMGEHGLIGPDGLFAYDAPGGVAGFITQQDRDAYFFEAAHPYAPGGWALAGFAMINEWSPSGRPTDHVVAEFHIQRKFRGTGLGRAAAHALFTALPGTWELGILDDNTDARAFWPKTVQSGPCRNAEHSRGDGTRWNGDIWRFDVEQMSCRT